MRNWHPFIRETMARMQADGVERIVAICLAPQYSKLSVGFYFRRTQEAKQELGYERRNRLDQELPRSSAADRGFSQKLAAADCRPNRCCSPRTACRRGSSNSADPYDSEAGRRPRWWPRARAWPTWDFAYQSQGMTDEKWLGPTVESRLDAYAAEGVGEVVLAPIGFVSDQSRCSTTSIFCSASYARRARHRAAPAANR